MSEAAVRPALRLLSDEGLQKIHQQSLEILENFGMNVKSSLSKLWGIRIRSLANSKLCKLSNSPIRYLANSSWSELELSKLPGHVS